MPRHWGLRAAAGKMLKAFSTVYCASGKRFAAVPKTSGERRREHMHVLRVLSRSLLQYGLPAAGLCCSLAGWPSELAMLRCHLEPPKQRLYFGLQRSLYASYSCLNGPRGRAAMRALFGSRATQRSTLPPTCFSAIRFGQRQKDSSSSDKKQRNLHGFYLKAWSVLAVAVCCIMDWCS